MKVKPHHAGLGALAALVIHDLIVEKEKQVLFVISQITRRFCIIKLAQDWLEKRAPDDFREQVLSHNLAWHCSSSI